VAAPLSKFLNTPLRSLQFDNGLSSSKIIGTNSIECTDCEHRNSSTLLAQGEGELSRNINSGI
jgi:hypothetical protein